jgi:transketolase
MRKQFVKTIEGLLPEKKELVVLLGDIGVHGFKNSMLDFPERVLNIGILESASIGMAAGLAKTGLIPVVHTIAPFLVERAYEQIKVDLGYQKLGCNLVSVGSSYDYASLGCTHHCPGDVGVLLFIPGVEIVIPGSPKEFDRLFQQSYENGKPTYYRLSEKSHTQNIEVSFGKANKVKGGSKAVVITYGPMLQAVIEATLDLDVTVLYYTTIIPFDKEALNENITSSGRVILIEPFYTGSTLHLITGALDGLKVSIKTIGIPREFLRKYGKSEEHDEELELNSKTLSRKISEFIDG